MIDWIAADRFNPGTPRLYRPILDSLLNHDPYFILADFESYCSAHQRLDHAYTDGRSWLRKVVRNVAQMGHFSADRSIKEYVADIWKVSSFHVEVE